MNYEHRKEIYKQIEELRKRPVVSYITSLRPNATGQMAPDVIPEFARIVSKIEEKHRAIDLLIIFRVFLHPRTVSHASPLSLH